MPICLHEQQASKDLDGCLQGSGSGTIAWADIEALLVAAGAEVIEGSGSRVRFCKGDAVETFHRPHPEKEAKRYQVKAARDFLRRIGVTP